MKNKITLSELLELGLALQATRLNLKNLNNDKRRELGVNRIVNHNSRKRSVTEQWQRPFQTINKRKRFGNSDPRIRTCYRCGSEDHMAFYDKCPAKHRFCNRCSKMSNLKNMCKTRISNLDPVKHNPRTLPIRKIEKSKENVTDEIDQDESKRDGYIFHIGPRNENSVKYEIIIGDVPLEVLIESGSEVNVIDQSTCLESLKMRKISIIDSRKGSNKHLRGYGSKSPLSIIGEFTEKLISSTAMADAAFYVVKEGVQALLGRKTSLELGVLKIGDINLIEESVGKIKDVVADISI